MKKKEKSIELGKQQRLASTYIYCCAIAGLWVSSQQWRPVSLCQKSLVFLTILLKILTFFIQNDRMTHFILRYFLCSNVEMDVSFPS